MWIRTLAAPLLALACTGFNASAMANDGIYDPTFGNYLPGRSVVNLFEDPDMSMDKASSMLVLPDGAMNHPWPHGRDGPDYPSNLRGRIPLACEKSALDNEHPSEWHSQRWDASTPTPTGVRSARPPRGETSCDGP